MKLIVGVKMFQKPREGPSTQSFDVSKLQGRSVDDGERTSWVCSRSGCVRG